MGLSHSFLIFFSDIWKAGLALSCLETKYSSDAKEATSGLRGHAKVQAHRGNHPFRYSRSTFSIMVKAALVIDWSIGLEAKRISEMAASRSKFGLSISLQATRGDAVFKTLRISDLLVRHFILLLTCHPRFPSFLFPICNCNPSSTNADILTLYHTEVSFSPST